MFYLLWMILNTALVLYFLYICFRGGKLIKEKFGLFAVFVFAFGLMSFMSGISNKNNVENKSLKWESAASDHDLAFSSKDQKVVVLANNLMFSIKLKVNYTDENGKLVPYNAYCTLNGLAGFFRWQPESISVQKKENSENSYVYEVYGKYICQLIGMDVYTSHVEYKGSLQPD